MFVKRKKNRSGTVSLVVAEKIKGAYKELHTVGIAKGQKDVEDLVKIGHEWIFQEEARRHHRLDLFGEQREAYERIAEDSLWDAL